MNNTYYETLDENFAQALKLYEQEFSHGELINLLKVGNIVQKQIAALKLETVTSVEDADVLLANLTGQDGKIREAVSMRLNEFMANPLLINYFKNPDNYPVFLDAVIDINGNICRNIIGAVANLKEDLTFCEIFSSRLVVLISGLLDKIEKMDFQDGKYKVNKEVFKLYWCLETVYVFWDKLDFEDLKQILLRSKNIEEYTIREKAAKILAIGFEDEQLNSARIELQNDRNYYVRRF